MMQRCSRILRSIQCSLIAKCKIKPPTSSYKKMGSSITFIILSVLKIYSSLISHFITPPLQETITVPKWTSIDNGSSQWTSQWLALILAWPPSKLDQLNRRCHTRKKRQSSSPREPSQSSYKGVECKICLPIRKRSKWCNKLHSHNQAQLAMRRAKLSLEEKALKSLTTRKWKILLKIRALSRKLAPAPSLS